MLVTVNEDENIDRNVQWRFVVDNDADEVDSIDFYSKIIEYWECVEVRIIMSK